MCTVSMVGDHFNDKWKQPDYSGLFNNLQNVSRYEYEQLKKEVEDMKKLLERAVEYDKKNNEPHCEMEDKVKILKEVAKMFGIDLSDIFKDSNP